MLKGPKERLHSRWSCDTRQDGDRAARARKLLIGWVINHVINCLDLGLSEAVEGPVKCSVGKHTDKIALSL